MEMALSNEFCEMKQDEMLVVDGGANLDTIAAGFTTVCGTITTVCLLTTGAAATAAVSTIAAPVVVIGVAGGILGGAIISMGLNQ